jgi:hypothetical protein
MSVERKNPLKRNQALNDATRGQIGDEPRSVPEQGSDLKNERMKTAGKCQGIYNNQELQQELNQQVLLHLDLL